jgi:DNA-binding response OmpR family regulator
MLIESYLEDMGHKVVGAAARLREALRLARTLDVDLAVLDVNLDGELSYPVAQVLRERGVPFLFATGYGVAGLPDGLGDPPVLPKPFRQEQLASAICRAQHPR